MINLAGPQRLSTYAKATADACFSKFAKLIKKSLVVERRGIEPLTSALRTPRSPN